LRLSADGLATTLALKQHENTLSCPGFSARLFARIGQIEARECGPREVLLDLLPQLAPDVTPSPIAALV
jgi:hypothetical protein